MKEIEIKKEGKVWKWIEINSALDLLTQVLSYLFLHYV